MKFKNLKEMKAALEKAASGDNPALTRKLHAMLDAVMADMPDGELGEKDRLEMNAAVLLASMERLNDDDALHDRLQENVASAITTLSDACMDLGLHPGAGLGLLIAHSLDAMAGNLPPKSSARLAASGICGGNVHPLKILDEIVSVIQESPDKFPGMAVAVQTIKTDPGVH